MDSLDYLDLLDETGPRDAVLSLLAHVAFADGTFQADEFTLLQQLVPRMPSNELRTWVEETVKRPFDAEATSKALGSEQQRWKALRFAARMAWTDRVLESHEMAFLVELAAAFELPPDAVENVLDVMVGRGNGEVGDAGVRAALIGMIWEELDFNPGHPRSALARVAPDEGAVGVLYAEGMECLALFPSGLAGGFREGDAFVGWSDIESYNRVPVFGAAVRLELRDGRDLTLVDVRLRPIAGFLDRLFGSRA